ncbi:hypothetical protein AX27061_3895 [Achromobacter xylosoxidans NBRC 15126 = ATCC 27061]|nr:hypothetical protein AX27061_3895 [Achromobacter xylosoxidans NBRC 15126 = ATCC 27061]CCH09579.1 hypothetical protein NH44784_056371 [Achromobacter xylosoxidans NH44784-1996]
MLGLKWKNGMRSILTQRFSRQVGAFPGCPLHGRCPAAVHSPYG